MTYPPTGDQDPDRPQSPYGQPASDPGNPYGQYGQHPEAYGQGRHAPGYGEQPGYGPGQYGSSQYGPGPHRPGGTSTNVLAILALVFAFVFAPAGIVLGHLARKQIRQSGEQGWQLAQWGLILSYVFTALGLAACCAWIGVLIWAGSNGDGYQ